jgi:hypothetical protein
MLILTKLMKRGGRGVYEFLTTKRSSRKMDDSSQDRGGYGWICNLCSKELILTIRISEK